MELKSIKVGRTVIPQCKKQNAVSVTEPLLLQDTAKNIILKKSTSSAGRLWLSEWHCWHRVCGAGFMKWSSVCLSVWLFHHSTTAAARRKFAAECRAGERYWSTAAAPGAHQQHGEQCHVHSWCRRLNTDFYNLFCIICTLQITCPSIYCCL